MKNSNPSWYSPSKDKVLGALPNDIRDALSPLHVIAYELITLERAMSVLGMNQVAQQLHEYADVLKAAQDAAVTLAQRHFNEMIRDTEQASVNTLRAMLAGAEIGGRVKEVK